MKAIKILIFTIITILVLGAVTVALVYFYTDTFKSNQEIFYKYISEEQAANLIDVKSLETLLNKVQTENNEQNIKLLVNASSGNATVIDNQKLELVNKIDNENKKEESTIKFGNAQNENVLEINLAKEDNLLGLGIKDITTQYMAIENKNLKSFAESIGLDSSNIPNKIELGNYIEENTEEVTSIQETAKELYNLLKNNTDKTNYSKLSKSTININGTNTEVAGYELSLNSKKLNEILSKSNNDVLKNLAENNLELSAKIYLQNKNLVKCSIIMQDADRAYSIRLEKDSTNLSLVFNNSNEGQYIKIEVTTNGDVNSDSISYIANISINSDEENLTMNIELEAEFKFNSTLDITSLKDNSILLNDYSGDEVSKILQVIIERIFEKEGVNDSLLGIGVNPILESSELIKSTQENLDTQAIEMFNSRFTAYEGVTTGVSVKSLLTVVETSNATGDLSVTVNFNGEEKTANNLIAVLDSNRKYTVSFDYDNSGYINLIKIDE